MLKNLLFVTIVPITALLTAQSSEWDPKITEVWEPEPKEVTFDDHNVPSDAIILFDGVSTNAWNHKDGSAIGWDVAEGIMTVRPGTGPIFTKEKFGDIQLHLEWRAPLVVEGEGQGRGNSGVFLQGRYEVQILDSYQNRTYSNGQASSIYKQSIPLVNATKPTGEWQTYDIIYKAPVFNAEGMKTSAGTVTVLHNGVVVQNHYVLRGSTVYRGLPTNKAHGDDVIQLQDHSNPVSFRNIWLRRL